MRKSNGLAKLRFANTFRSIPRWIATIPVEAARETSRVAKADGYETLKAAHAAAWEKIWDSCDVVIEGDDEAQFALRYSLYQLQLTAPRHSSKLSIPARGLSGQVYKGAVFWDTEMFMTPLFTLTDPAVARNLILYRFQTLEGAKRKAAEYGFEGAFFAWESQETGDDACTDFNVSDVFTGRPMRTHFRDKQIHVSADIVYALRKYIDQTGDESILADGADELLAECARFLCSWAYYKKDKSRYELLDVVGPDEYHERVHNNAYTNRIAKFALETAFQTLEKQASTFPDLGNWKEVADELYIPQPNEEGIIPQFDGYEKLEDCTLEEAQESHYQSDRISRRRARVGDYDADSKAGRCGVDAQSVSLTTGRKKSSRKTGNIMSRAANTGRALAPAPMRWLLRASASRTGRINIL